MRSSTWRLEDLRNVILNLGFVGENLHTRQIFDCKKMFDQYPNASVSMTVTPPEGEPYPGTIERDGDLVIWDVRDSDLVAGGDGEIQLVFTQEPHIARSYNAQTHICRSQVPTGSIPSGLDDYITRADQLLDQVEDTFPAGGTTGQVLAKKSDTDYDTEWVDQGGGTEDYDELENRPQIGGVTLTGNKTLHDLGAASEADVEAKYTKPATGIPASDLAAGVIPDPENLIDDTAGAGDTDKVWSADKSSALLTEINSKADEPTGTKSAGKVYGLDSNLNPAWVDGGGGGSVDPQDIAEAVDAWCDENITNPDSPPLDRSLTASSAAAPADITGDLKNAVDEYVVEEVVNNLMQQITPQDLRISASNGATTANGNWKSYVIDIDDIDETVSVKLYSSSTSYANIAYYNSKTTLDSSTNVGTPVTASGSGTYLEASYSDLNIPSTAVCVVFCTNVNGSEAFIHKTIKTPKVYTRSEVDAIVEPYKYTPYLMSWHELGGIFKFGMQATGNVGSKIQGSGSNKWNYSYYDISGQSHLKVSTAIYGSLTYGVYFTTSDDTIVSRYLLKGSDVAESISNYDLEVPASATKIYVNTYSQERTNPSVKGITTNNDTATALELRLLSFNCGQFDYGDGSTTDEQYKSNWRSLINDTVFDLCALQDYVATFGELQDEAKDVLFGSTIKSFLGTGSNSEDGLRLASRLNAGFLGAIDVGGGSGIWRSTVLKYNVFALEKNIIVYVGHYQPGADYVSARATQYANVIADAVANGYEYVIFCGDFNAQTISEYQPFKDAGYEICNGGYTGDHVTLRDIYADNIVYTSNLMETHFEVITGHTLNTDHYPILVTLKVKS